MIYHVLPGDAQVAEFKKTGIDGELIVCREALISGPIDAENLDDFWNVRAAFILAEYGEDVIDYHEKVADPLNKLTELDAGDEVNLWFEYELFCSVNMWFCLSLIEPTGASVYRVEPIGLDMDDRWNGFGGFTGDDLLAASELRSEFGRDEIKCGASLWKAYRKRDNHELTTLATVAPAAFPYLSEVVAAAVQQEIRPLEVVREITAVGETDFSQIFIEFKKRAGVYGYGDLQVQRLLDQMS